ncbi:hypothetical protein IQ249_25185 [Lusitaniella coriacea LEGE 07157]|uniref:Uncharacterized protein n=1 Tax=Lusitaniella coriacea LEGE 07157 TaxID=945747 RepID=A0A8J7E0L1_9CYAN|nr:hypothetical protein [Lusitaniella coriacea]MBE9119152.1 hypothetical protein [Lusitaniella coriacea LEGE 07157]
MARHNQEKIFRQTLKRSCYILINNWSTLRDRAPILQLVELFAGVSEPKRHWSPERKAIRHWVLGFLRSDDFQELAVFLTQKNQNLGKSNWSDRYATYLLGSQSSDSNQPQYRRDVARVLSQQLRNKFKFELTRYIAHFQLKTRNQKILKNPTILGDRVLSLIRHVLMRRGIFGHENLARIFLSQTAGMCYKDFKKSLLRYLLFLTHSEGRRLEPYLESVLLEFNQRYDDEVWNSYLLFATCKRLLDCLTIDREKKSSVVLTLSVTNSYHLTLSIVILKIILICEPSYAHLESCIATLIEHYGDCIESECLWLIHFLETLKVTLTIYADNIHFDLIENGHEECTTQVIEDVEEDYQVFSQIKMEPTLPGHPYSPHLGCG